MLLPDSVNLKYPGYLKILEPILIRSKQYRVAGEGEPIDSSWTIVPFGVIMGAHYSRHGFDVAYLVDSVSLGYRSVVWFYVRRWRLFHPELWWNLLRYIKYAPLERDIVFGYRKVIVASRHDAGFLEKRYKRSNIVVIENGVEVGIDSSALVASRSKSDFGFRLGMLSFWGAGKPHDFTWFIEEILPPLRRHFPAIRIVLAGRGGNDQIRRYFESNGCEFVGDVRCLGEFFSSIDIFFTSMRKECGILNKVLDAFAHRKIVVGFEPNMRAFSALKSGFMTYSNASELIQRIEFVKDNPGEARAMEARAYEYVVKHHNWDEKVERLNELFDDSAVV